MTSKIESELASATKLERAKGETDQDWRIKLVRAVGKLPEKDFNALSEPAYDWYHANAKRLKEKQELLVFGDEPAEEPPKRKRETVEEQEETPPARSREKARDEAKPRDEDKDPPARRERSAEEKPKPAPPSMPRGMKRDEDDTKEEPPARRKSEDKEPPAEKPKSKPAPKKKDSGGVPDAHRDFRQLVLERSDLSKNELMDLAHEKGIKLRETSMATVIYHTQQTIELLKEIHGIEVPSGKK